MLIIFNESSTYHDFNFNFHLNLLIILISAKLSKIKLFVFKNNRFSEILWISLRLEAPMNWPSFLLAESYLHLQNQVSKISYESENVLISNSIFGSLLTSGAIEVENTRLYVASSTFDSCVSSDKAGTIRIDGESSFYLQYLCISKCISDISCHVLRADISDSSLPGVLEQISASNNGNDDITDTFGIIGGSVASKNVNISHTHAFRASGFTLKGNFISFLGYSTFDNNFQVSTLIHLYGSNTNLLRCNFLNHVIDENDPYQGLIVGTDTVSFIESCVFIGNGNILVSARQNSSITCYRCFYDESINVGVNVSILKSNVNLFDNSFRYECGIGCNDRESVVSELSNLKHLVVLSYLCIIEKN